MKAQVKFIVMALIAIALWTWLVTKQEKESARHEALCAQSKECLDKQAKSTSKRSIEPITSKSGNLYFRGLACGESCERIVEGYRFAEKVGLTNKEGCDSEDSQHRSGCLAYYKELMESRYDSGEDTDPRH